MKKHLTTLLGKQPDFSPASTQNRFKCLKSGSTNQHEKIAQSAQQGDLWNILESQMKNRVSGWPRTANVSSSHRLVAMDTNEASTRNSEEESSENLTKPEENPLARLKKPNAEPVGRLEYTGDYVKMSNLVDFGRIIPSVKMLKSKTDTSRDTLLQMRLDKWLPKKESQPRVVYSQEPFDLSKYTSFLKNAVEFQEKRGDKNPPSLEGETKAIES